MKIEDYALSIYIICLKAHACAFACMCVRNMNCTFEHDDDDAIPTEIQYFFNLEQGKQKNSEWLFLQYF